MKSRTPAVFDESILGEHGKLAIVDDEGVSFTSHIDGTLYRFTPERSVEIQHNLGADIFFAFDECTSPEAEYEYQKEAMDRTHKWAERSLYAHRQNLDTKQAIFGIVQGGRHEDLREESSKKLGSMNFDGYGIGGSFSKEDLGKALAAGLKHLPEEKPRHLLGIGEPADMFEGVANGIDTFDCVAATRLARNGTVYTLDGPIDLTKSAYKEDMDPIEKDLPDSPAAPYTRAYLAHLFRAKEMLGAMICSQHNLYFILKLVDDMRRTIKEGKFEEFKESFTKRYYS
ncbi:MAG: tRNA guanosine(34) transglycosylase Tgt [Patescibacteria group bacterium UBA2103]